MNIGDRVKKLRKEKSMTQEQLAERLGYKSKSSVAHIENGRDIPRSLIVQLADILGTSPAYLMGWEDEAETVSNNEKTPSVPERTKDEWRDVISELSEDEVRELWTFVHFLRYRRVHSDFRED